MTNDKKTQAEAAAFRRLTEHLRNRTDVQNIELMNLAGFCRNCLSKWYHAALEDLGEQVEYEDVRSEIYGMPYEEWKKRYHSEPTAEQQAEFLRLQSEVNH
jgi:hypothetical protein